MGVFASHNPRVSRILMPCWLRDMDVVGELEANDSLQLHQEVDSFRTSAYLWRSIASRSPASTGKIVQSRT